MMAPGRRMAGVALLVLWAWVLTACEPAGTGPTPLQLADLVRFSERYDGDPVVTQGVVRTFPEPRHFWIEDEARNRVAIEPGERVADRVGERVRVWGRFHRTPERGRYIEVERVAPLDR